MIKKILIVTDSLKCGGSEMSLVSLLNSVSDLPEYQFDLLLLQGGGVFERYVPTQVDVAVFSGFEVSNSLFTLLRRGALKAFLKKIKLHLLLYFNRKRGVNKHSAEIFWHCVNDLVAINKEQYDVAIAFNQGLSTYFVAEKVSAIRKIARINVDMFSVNYSSDYNQFFYDRFDSVISISDGLSKNLLENYSFLDGKLVVVKNVFNIPLILMMGQEKVFHDQFTGVRLVTVGRLEVYKGFDLAIEAASILRSQGVSFRWYVIGEGSQYCNLKKMIEERALDNEFILEGMKINPYSYINESNIYVQTSLFEGFGRTVTEAKVFHKPIVTTNFDAVFDQITDEKTGLIVDKTPMSIANGILRLIEDNALCESLSKNLSIEMSTYAADIDAQNLLKVIEQ